MQEFDDKKQDDRLLFLRKREEEDLIKILSDKYGIPYIDLSTVSIEGDALKLLTEEKARAAEIATFQLINKKVFIAARSPDRNDTKIVIEEIKAKGYSPTLFIASTASLERAWARYKEVSFASETKSGLLDVSSEFLHEAFEKIETVPDITNMVNDVLKKTGGHKISVMLEILLAGSVAVGASDIHIEPEEKDVHIRARLDGVLENLLTINYDTYKLLASRIKLLSGLKLNVMASAQDGRFSIKLNEKEIEIRSSVIPGAYGESFVMRILNPENIAVPFESLGVNTHLFEIIERELKRPNGIILTTGPTGSGKTTTLYAFLRKLYSPGSKMITIEDPIEYHLEGITQTQTNDEKGYTFLEGLRSALRQDPDVIMVGEIRDTETAKIAINSALTGHLVFSTLHTNTAAGAIPRLIDLGVDAKIISSALNVSLAQRLARKLCTFCKKESPATENEKRVLTAVVERIKEEKKDYALSGLESLLPVSKLFQSVGCEKCNNTGFKGRVGIYEAILTDENIEKAIIENPTERGIKKAAIPQGILDMQEDATVKILQGLTSFDEISRVVDLEEV
jgi:type IV pilus assembly protein PilB